MKVTLVPIQGKKHREYNQLVTNAAAIQNVIDLTGTVRELQADDYVDAARGLGSAQAAADETSQRFCHHTLSLGAPDPLKTNLIVACPSEEAASPGPIP